LYRINLKHCLILFILIVGVVLTPSISRSWVGMAVLFDQLAWSPDGKKLCFRASLTDSGIEYADRHNIMAVEVSNPKDIYHLTPVAKCYPIKIALSNNLDKVAFVDEFGLWVMNLATGGIKKPLFMCPTQRDSIQKIAWSLDDKRIACLIEDYGTLEKNLFIVDEVGKRGKRKKLERDVIDFMWATNETLICSVVAKRDERYNIIEISCKEINIDKRTISKQEYELMHNNLVASKTSLIEKDGEVLLVTPIGKPQKISKPKDISWWKNLCLSPDGSRVVFVTSSRKSDGSTEYYLAMANIDGSGFKQITEGFTNYPYSPLWVLGGNKILYIMENSFYMVNQDGTSNHRLTVSNGSEPVWAPNSEEVIFKIDGTEELCKVNIYTGKMTPVVLDSLKEYYYSKLEDQKREHKQQGELLSPDKKSIAYIEGLTDFRGYYSTQICVDNIERAKKRVVVGSWANF